MKRYDPTSLVHFNLSPFQRAFRRNIVPRNIYSEIHLHLTWHTKANANVLMDDVERQLHRYLRHRAMQTDGVIVHAVGGIADHVHMAVSVPPTVTVSEWIGELKGASAYFINHEICNRKILEWQTGYGVVSFGTKDLPWVENMFFGKKSTMRVIQSRVVWSGLSGWMKSGLMGRRRGKPVETGYEKQNNT